MGKGVFYILFVFFIENSANNSSVNEHGCIVLIGTVEKQENDRNFNFNEMNKR